MMNRHLRPLIGWSEKMQDLHAEIAKTAPTNMTVMLRGERGTGKELIAREIHLKSKRGGPSRQICSHSVHDRVTEF